MADNNREIRTKLILNHSEKENYYLFVRKDKNDVWSLPSNIVTRGQSIEESAKNISNSVSFPFTFCYCYFHILLVFKVCFICWFIGVVRANCFCMIACLYTSKLLDYINIKH